MIKCIIFLIMLLSFGVAQYTSGYEEKVEGNFNKIEYYPPKELVKINEILEDKSSFLSEQEKENLLNLKDKLNNYQVLTQEEVDFIRECDLKIIRGKLGDSKFEEYSKLINKRATKSEFDQDERLRLFQLEKEIKGIK